MAYYPPPQFQSTRSLEQYYASKEGGNCAFASTTGAVSVGTSGGTYAAFLNPSNSGIDCYIARTVVGTNRAGRIERYRNPTILPVGSSQAILNRGGGTNTAKSQLYAGSAANVSGGTMSKVLFLPATSTDSSLENGAIILKPGQSYSFWFIPDTNQSALATIELVWWELATQI